MVLGILYYAGSDECPVLKKLTENFDAITNANQETSIKSDIKLADFLPKDKTIFYRYRGSLTTPPCAETVTWIVFSNMNYVGQSQMKKYRSLLGHDKKPMSNIRDLQPLNGRKIEVSDAKSCNAPKLIDEAAE